MRMFAIVIAAAGISACASSAPSGTDPTPLVPVTLIETRFVNEGIKGLFPTETTERSYVRANMRRDETVVKGTGKVTKYVVSTTSEARIWRLDRDLLWAINPDKKEYTECPLSGCPGAANRPTEEKKPTPEPLHEPGCTMKITDSSFTVAPTGKKRTINGFSTDGYDIAWKVVMQDVIARKTTSTIGISLWTTPMTPTLRPVLDLEQGYVHALAGKIPGPDRGKLLPQEISQMIAANLTGALSEADRDRAALFNLGKQMEKVKGHPISTRIHWDLQGDACALRETESGGITGIFSKKKPEGAKALATRTILSYLIEVKTLKADLVRESMFNLPNDYRQVK